MSEHTYTRLVQGLILFIVVVGALYAEPAASAARTTDSALPVPCFGAEGPI